MLERFLRWMINREKGKMTNSFKTVSIDFDGVICPVPKGKLFDDELGSRPADAEIVELIRQLHFQGYVILIFSARVLFSGSKGIKKYLNENDIPFHRITVIKFPALVYIDDAAVRYESGVTNGTQHIWNAISDREKELEGLCLEKEKIRLKDASKGG